MRQLQMAKALEEAAQANLHLVAYENITAEVLNGIEFTSKRYDSMLEKVITDFVFVNVVTYLGSVVRKSF